MPNSLASPIPSIAEADQLLEGLDRLARSDVADGEFWQQFLAVLQGMSGGTGVAVLLPMRSEWLPVARGGEVPMDQVRSAGNLAAKFPKQSVLEGMDSESRWIAARVDSTKEGSGILWIGYRKSDSQALQDSGRLLLEPFCEILRARQAASASRFGSGWLTRIEEGIQSLMLPDSPEDLRQALVDRLVLAMRGARVSLIARTSDSEENFRLMCSSGSTNVDRMSATVKRLEKLAWQAAQQGNLLAWNNPTDGHRDEHGVFNHGIALAWDRTADRSAQSWLIVEWLDSAAMNQAVPLLSSWCNTMYPIWLQKERWTRLPKRVQQRLLRQPQPLPQRFRTWLRRGIGLALVLGLLGGLCWPVPMMIESEAILEPVSRRLVHASADGYVDELLVEDGDRVASQQVLGRLRSPSLDLQIEEALGQLRAIAEKRNGLKVAINQLSPNAPDALANQTRLSTELLMLDSEESHTREMLEFYQAEQSRLVLRSPIDGIVVARQLRQELETRPIRRGDPLLQIVDLSGAWQLRIQVADRDTHYVARFYGESVQANAAPASSDQRVHYMFDSLPGEPLTAQVTQIARIIENRNGAGGFQEVFASVPREDASKVHMGATARVQFSCGRESFAFVWSRPLIEFLQTRFRLFSYQQESISSTPSKTL